MSDHLTDRQVEGYRDRRVLPEELLAIDEHTSGCSRCASLLRDPQRVRDSLVLWRSDFEAAETGPFGHISYEQQSAYVDDAADATERKIVESHLRICGRCSVEVGDLQRFSGQFANVTAASKTENASRLSPRLFERFAALWGRPRLWIPLQLAATAGAIIVFGWFFTSSIRNQNAELKKQLELAQQENQAIQQQFDEATTAVENLQSQIAELQQSYLHDVSPERENRIAVSLNDGEGEITLDRAGKSDRLEIAAAGLAAGGENRADNGADSNIADSVQSDRQDRSLDGRIRRGSRFLAFGSGRNHGTDGQACISVESGLRWDQLFSRRL
jgi:anti-sigma factor RsiW